MEPFATGWLGVDLKTTPTGDLAFPDFIGAIKRIVYSPSNRSPSAVLGATPTNGPAPLAVLFDAAGSTDPNGDPLTYDWDFGDGTQHGSQRNPLQTYTQAGVYTARITVSDGRGLSDTKTITIAVSTHPPMASITSPPNGSLYRDGQTIQLQGTASDPEDGTLPASAFRWTVRLHHGSHIHLLNTFTGVVAPSFTALVDHDADSFYEVELKVTDSDGLTDSRIIELRPETVAFTLASVPEGAPLSYSGIEGVGPMFRTAAIGYRTTISAAESFLSDGREWVFDHWSDGGARAHDVTVPASATNLTAFYRDTAVGGAAPNTATPQSPPTPPSAGPKPDATRPIVRITAPRRRATVAGRVRLRAIASDNVGIQTVQFKLDGRRLGRADSRAPFWLRWNTRTVKNGTHRLTAIARDGAGNTTISRVVRIKVKNERRSGRRGS